MQQGLLATFLPQSELSPSEALLSRMLAFFAFWSVTAASSWLTYTLGLSATELNEGPDHG